MSAQPRTTRLVQQRVAFAAVALEGQRRSGGASHRSGVSSDDLQEDSDASRDQRIGRAVRPRRGVSPASKLGGK